MESLRRWIREEGRARARWTALFFGLLLLTLVWPATDGAQAQAKTTILWLWSFAVVFQFGRLLQTWSARPLLLGAQPERELAPGGPSWATVPTIAAAPPSVSPTRQRYAGPEIRAFASVEEAATNGWSFSDPVALFGDKPVPGSATLNGVAYDYSGLLAAGSQVPPDMRVFGTLAYSRRAPAPPATETNAALVV